MNLHYRSNAAAIVIEKAALTHNLTRIRQLAPNSEVMAVVKANGYGHGLLMTAQTLVGADSFGVARLSEALILRQGGITKPILLLEGFVFSDELPILAQYQIATVIHSKEQIEALEKSTLSTPITVWLKIDTGMHRLGVRPEEAANYYQRLSRCANVVQPINIMSHFSSADEQDPTSTLKQIACFTQFRAGKIGKRSIAASAGLLRYPEAHYDLIRPGIILYGVSPFSDKTGEELGLQPAMTLKSNLIAIRSHKAGEAVGYNATWVSPRDTYLGVVAIGYGDGYPRSAPSGTPVLINGRRVPLVGRVSMDMIMVDLGTDPHDHVGDDVILWGTALPIETIMHYTGISAYELLTKLTSRVECYYK